MATSDLGKNISSVHDEHRIKKLFQACDTNGDGYIDSHDLLAICRELNLEHSLDELMIQLGADSDGRISYEQFLRRRLDLVPEIDALKCVNGSDKESQGRLDSWEWDSGARDLSPVPPQQAKSESVQSDVESSYPSDTVQRLLDEQAQRYDQQITELHSVIAELTRKLQQQRTMAIAEEDETSEIGETSAADDSVSNVQTETDTKNSDENVVEVEVKEVVLKSSAEAAIVETQQNTWPQLHSPCNDRFRTVRSDAATHTAPPIVTKMAERVRLRRAVETEEQTESNDPPDIEVVRLGAQLDHARAQNALLALTLDDAKEQCNRLSLLCGKYESNAVALSVALRLTDAAIEAYDVLLALLETELSMDESRPDSLETRSAVEVAAFQLLSRLDSSSSSSGTWTARHEAKLREHVSRLKQERASVRNTCVELESLHLDSALPPLSASNHEMRKMDLETAVLLQEMMLLREQKAELVSRLVQCERERESALTRLQEKENSLSQKR